jgi:macrolide transport system ATP-binding/permease protein
MLLGELWRRLRFWLHRDALSTELDEEMRLHQELRSEQLQASAGLAPAQASVRARRQFGNVTRLAEVSREVWSVRWLDELSQDARFAIRQLHRAPGFAAVAILSLALGIGANTAIFTLINAVLLTSLPVRDPAGLYLLGDASESGTGAGDPGGKFVIASNDLYHHLQDTHVFSGLCAVQSEHAMRVTIRSTRSSAAAQPAAAKLVSGNFFDVLGAGTALGRTLGPSDDSAAAPVGVVSYRYWRSSLSSDPAVIGSVLDVTGIPVSIVGVAMPTFYGPTLQADPPDIWLPLSLDRRLEPEGKLLDTPEMRWLYLIGRLPPSVSPAQAQARLTMAFKNWIFSTFSAQIDAEDRPRELKSYIELTPAGGGVGGMRRDYAKTLRLLFGAALAILLIACANLSALLLARGTARRTERVVRLALGGGRWRLVRQALTESVMLALMGGGLGLAVAAISTRLLIAAVFSGASYVPIQSTPDLRVLAFAFALSCVAAIAVGLLPILRMDKEISSATSGSRVKASGFGAGKRLGLGQALIVVEAALAVVVLVVAGGFLRSLQNLTHQEFGFDHAHLLAANIDLARAGYDHSRLDALYRELDSRLNALPGVESASFSTYSPFDGCCSAFSIAIEGREPTRAEPFFARIDRVSPRYFRTIGTQVILGRGLDDRDSPTSTPVAVVNQAFVDRYFPHENPLGRRFGFGGQPKRGSDLEIVGVVQTAKYDNAREDPRPMAFLPFLQQPRDPIRVMLETDFAGVVQLRSSGSPEALIHAVRATLVDVNPRLSPLHVAAVADDLSDTLSQDKVLAALVTFFGLLGLVLTCVGLYGITAFSVQRRTGEIGIRMALGARQTSVTGMVMRTVLMQGLLGLVLGVLAAFAVGRIIASQLYGVSPTDPRNAALAVVGLITCVALAGFIPARRAARIDPVSALRNK